MFPSAKPRTPLSDMALSAVIKRMNGAAEPPPWRDAEGRAVVPHGFRSSFRDWVAEATNHPSDIAEAALAHKVANQVEAAYRRGDLFEKRRKLMADWASWCELTAEAGVIESRPTTERAVA